LNLELRKFLTWLPNFKTRPRSKVLALGGGGVRGFAHTGVIKVLEEQGWYPDLITGTSMGSIIGALYAMHPDAERLEEAIREHTSSEWFSKLGVNSLAGFRRNSGNIDSIGTYIKYLIRQRFREKEKHPISIFPPNFLIDILRRIFGLATFYDLKIPFIAVATDLYSGKNLELHSGPLARAVAASSSIPGIFCPVKYANMLLVDGCVTRNIPIPASADEQDHEIIAVDVQPSLKLRSELNNPFDVIYRVDDITTYHLNRFYLDKADIVLEPDVRDINWDDFDDIQTLIDAGEKAAREHFHRKQEN